MRTTVRLSESLIARAKREAAQRGTTLTSLIEQGLRLVMAKPHRQSERPRVKLPTCKQRGGAITGIDLNNSAALLDAMEKRG